MGGTTQNTIFNNQCNPEKDFIFLLHRMKIAMQNVDYFKILISDTITFFKGNPHLLVFNNDDVDCQILQILYNIFFFIILESKFRNG